MRCARLKRGLHQSQVAEQCGVTTCTFRNWETGKHAPSIHDLPRVHAFLGYRLGELPRTLGEEMRAYRQRHGLTIKEAAAKAGVSFDGWSVWEKTGWIHDRRCREAVEGLVQSRPVPKTK